MYEKGITEDLSLMFFTGISTLNLSLISRRQLGRKLFHNEKSEASNELSDAIEQWRFSDLSKESIKFLFIDGVNFKMHVDDSVEYVPV